MSISERLQALLTGRRDADDGDTVSLKLYAVGPLGLHEPDLLDDKMF